MRYCGEIDLSIWGEATLPHRKSSSPSLGALDHRPAPSAIAARLPSLTPYLNLAPHPETPRRAPRPRSFLSFPYSPFTATPRPLSQNPSHRPPAVALSFSASPILAHFRSASSRYPPQLIRVFNADQVRLTPSLSGLVAESLRLRVRRRPYVRVNFGTPVFLTKL